MVTDSDLRRAAPLALDEVHLPGLGERSQGKVRDIYRLGDGRRLLITTDRLSAFDRVLGLVPYKGQVLNQLSAFWFERTRDIVPNHLLSLPDPNAALVRECQALPVEIVVRGYITGVTTTSLWYHYSRGARQLYGLDLPEGLRKNERLPQPIITPTTRATGPGGHDERITAAEIVERGLVEGPLYRRLEEVALALFARGSRVASMAGLILVDTKYEFGLWEGELHLIDEVHTPDSSRFWRAETYEERLSGGQEPDSYDKELVRLWYAERGYTGEGEPPPWSHELAVQAARRYVDVYERLTGHEFEPGAYPAAPRLEANLRAAGLLPAGPEL
ncbi:MAG: phosphoribosylaminoimidazolesuccinocarboxamide synthase [Anaerolineae bacterium]|nr:phosphoribosylaminoimidazolesuccinocarboxamide synthase [Anaerolineae bacterium]